MDREVTYRGKGYQVPDWVQWVVTDQNGSVSGHFDEPVIGAYLPVWTSNGKFKQLSLTIASVYEEVVDDWKKSKAFVGKRGKRGQKIILTDDKKTWQDFPK